MSTVEFDRTPFMLFLDLTFDSAAENLALEDALLERCNEGGPEVLRVWNPRGRSVVVGYAQSVETEVNVGNCRGSGIPILRRITGGGTVFHNRGSLCYALVLRSDRAEINSVGAANAWIMERQMESVSREVFGCERAELAINGDTDLTLDGRKFSGNAQRRKKNAILFHGTFLLIPNLNTMHYLKFPSKQPEYRAGRSHDDFMTWLSIPKPKLIASLRETWGADEEYPHDEIPHARVAELVRERYGNDEWNFRL